MQLTAGIGWAALSPQRLTLRAYAEGQLYDLAQNPALAAAETLGPEIITARLRYGGLGTCQGGELSIVDAPPTWSERPRPRLVLIDLECEHGSVTVYRAVIDQIRRTGRLSAVTLIGVHQVFADGPELDADRVADLFSKPLHYPPLTTATAAFGTTDSRFLEGGDILTRRAALDLILSGAPEADWGVIPNGSGVMGKPTAATRYEIRREALGNARLGEAVSQGFTVPPYITDWTLRPAEGLGELAGQRAAPLLVSRRLGKGAIGGPQTVIVTENVPQNPSLGGQRGHFPDSVPSPFTPDAVPVNYGIVLPARSLGARPKQARITVPFRLDTLDAGSYAQPGATFEVRLLINPPSLAADRQELVTMTSAYLNANLNRVYEINRELLEQIETITVYVKAHQLDAASATATLGPITVAADMEVPNRADLTSPPEMSLPFWTGPTHQRTLNGVWLIPPAQDVEVNQDAAGVEVQWDKGTATSTYLTVALPYPGQRRGA